MRSGVISGRVVVVVASVVVGAIVVVEVVVEVDEVATAALVVDSATRVVTAETFVAPWAEPDEQALAARTSTAAPAITLERPTADIPSKYPLRRTKCWRSAQM
jgi:hypothetical protein